MIVGAGLAGAKAAEALRDEGFDGRIVLIGDEPDRPYERPPLSKGYLLGTAEREKVFVHPEDWYAEHDVDLRLRHRRSPRIDRAAQRGGARRRRAARLRPAAAGHRVGAPRGSTCPAPTSTACATCARLDDSEADQGRLSPASRGRGHRRRLDRAGGGGRGPRARAPRSPCSRRPSCRCCGCSATEVAHGVRRPAPRPRRRLALRRRRWPSSSAAAARSTGVLLADGTRRRRPTWCSSASASRPNDGAGRATPGSTSTTASWSTRTCAPPTRTSSPPATSPTPTTRCSAAASGSSTGPTPCNSGAAAAKSMLGQDVELRPAAVLLHRPVRPRHGVHRLRRAGRLRPGRVPRRPSRRRGSSSRSGCAGGRVLAG